LAAQLSSRGLNVVGTDMLQTEMHGGTAVRIPAASDPAMIGALRRLTLDHDIDLIIPTVSEELPLLSLAAAAFPESVLLLVARPGPVAVANDKLLTAWALADAGVPVPRFRQPSDCRGLEGAFAALGRPFIAKPRVSRGGRGVIVVRNAYDVDWASVDDNWILQEFAPGREYAPVAYRATQRPGATMVVVLEKTGLAKGDIGNATGVCRPPGCHDIAEIAVETVNALELTGPVDMDVRRLPDGRPVVLEVNARFGANSAAAPELLDAVLAEQAERVIRAA
jgi:carbamoyl-phosphate synthase large subunit